MHDGGVPWADQASFPAARVDEPTTLHAALEFVDQYELSDTEDALALVDVPANAVVAIGHHGQITEDDTALGSKLSDALFGETLSATTESRDAAKKTPAAGAVRSARQRRRDELVYLRSAVDNLEDQLATLKNHGDETSDGAVENEEPLAFVWQELASRQYEQRQRAEVENVKLRTMLEEQIRVAKNLERVLKKRTTAEGLLPSWTKRIRKSTPLDNESVFDDLLEMLDDMYPETDEIFADERFACTAQTLQDHHARNDDGDGPVVEVFDSRISPFDMQSVSDAMWHHLSMQSFDRSELHSELLEFTDEFFRLEYHSRLDLPRHKGSFHGKIAGRRIVEDDRILLLWAALVDPDTISGVSMDGVFMRQKGWTLIRRAPPAYEKPGRSVSLAQMYHIIIPEFNDHESEDEQRRKVGTLTHFVMSTVDFHVDVGRTIIENLLLDDGWKTPSTTASSPERRDDAPASTDTQELQ